ncbi:MAG: MurR/RpiR family transcriptional regulator [Candidatus Woesearchaeota archaeon]
MAEELTNKTKIVKKIKNQNLSNTETKIFDYIKFNPKKVMLMSLKEISEEVGVSGGSILNFCRSVLNLDGFSELKLQIAEDLSRSDATEPVVYNSFFEGLEIEYEQIYENIKKDIDDKKFKEFETLINNASQILIYDTNFGGISRIAVSFFYEKGLKNIDFIDNMNLGIKKILEMNKDDILLILSPGNDKFRGYNKLLEISDSKLISIVDDRLNDISQRSDLTFYTKTDGYKNDIIALLVYLKNLVEYFEIEN